MKRNPGGLLLILLGLLAVGFAGGLIFSSRISALAPLPAPAEQFPGATTPAPSRPAAVVAATANGLPDLSTIAETALKGTVSISSTSVVQRRTPWPFWDEGGQYERSQSLGSGVVVSPDGLILTNTHVIGPAGSRITDLKVTFANGREVTATKVDTDALSDLAVVRVPATGLATVPWGDSSKLRIAEWVLAIGNPFQLSGTVTLGIVSATSRSQSGAYTDFVQTDAAINPGSSGGALLNARGELVGINTQIATETGNFAGIGFAIPSNTARRLMEELVAKGSVSWGSIGQVVLVDSATARRNGYADLPGLLVYRLDSNSAAARGGLRMGDIILSFNGQKTLESDAFQRLVATAKVGDRIQTEIQRDGKRITLTIPIEDRNQQPLRRRQ